MAERKKTRDDFAPGDAGTKAFEDYEFAERKKAREANDPSMKAANQGATANERKYNVNTKRWENVQGAKAAPVDSEVGKADLGAAARKKAEEDEKKKESTKPKKTSMSIKSIMGGYA